MPIPAFTVYGNRPRLFFRDTDKTALTARTNTTASWKSLWDNTIVPRADTLKGMASTTMVNVGNADDRLIILAFVGWIEETGRPAGGYKDQAIKGLVALAGLADGVKPDLEERVTALAVAFDLCYADMTAGERTTVGAELFQQAGRLGSPDGTHMFGKPGIEEMQRVMCGIAGHGTGTQNWTKLINDAMGFWFGTPAQNDDRGRIETARYFHGDGCAEEVGHYLFRNALWAEMFFLLILQNGLSLNYWTSETWSSKLWEFIIWFVFRGSDDDHYEGLGDTGRVSAPFFHETSRWAMNILIDKHLTPNSTEGGKHLRWLHDQIQAHDGDNAEQRHWDVFLFDRAAAAVAPKDGSPVPSRSRLFAPPGLYYYRRGHGASAHWDYDNSSVIRISAPKYISIGHTHRDAGSVQMRWKDDVILQAPSGIYDDFGSDHHRNWYQRMCGQSLSPLVHDPGQTYQRYSDTVANDGGHHFKRFDNPVTGDEPRPHYVYEMLNDGGGKAWMYCERFEKKAEVADSHVFLVADVREGYKKKHTDAQRCTVALIKYLIIEPTAGNGLSYPALLYFCRLTKVNSTLVTEIPFHSYNAFTTTGYGFHTTGFRGKGKLWVDVRDLGNYTRNNQTPGTTDANGYGANSFQIQGTGTNWKPNKAANGLETPDLKRHTMRVTKTSRSATEDYVFLLMQTAAADSEPASGRAWVTDGAQPNYYGITLGSSTYLIHRTQDLIVVGAPAAPDTTPPAEVTGFAVTGRDQNILASWSADPADSDFHHANVYYRIG